MLNSYFSLVSCDVSPTSDCVDSPTASDDGSAAASISMVTGETYVIDGITYIDTGNGIYQVTYGDGWTE